MNRVPLHLKKNFFLDLCLVPRWLHFRSYRVFYLSWYVPLDFWHKAIYRYPIPSLRPLTWTCIIWYSIQNIMITKLPKNTLAVRSICNLYLLLHFCRLSVLVRPYQVWSWAVEERMKSQTYDLKTLVVILLVIQIFVNFDNAINILFPW